MDDRDGDGGGEYDECGDVPICTKGVSSMYKIMLAMMLTMTLNYDDILYHDISGDGEST